MWQAEAQCWAPVSSQVSSAAHILFHIVHIESCGVDTSGLPNDEGQDSAHLFGKSEAFSRSPKYSMEGSADSKKGGKQACLHGIAPHKPQMSCLQ